MDHNAILAEMGLTQWVRRDLACEQVAPGVKTEQGQVSLGVEKQSQIIEQETQLAPAVNHKSSAVDLAQLRVEIADCTACDLAKSRIQTVPGEGAKTADWLFIGEAPGQQEDRQGEPFVGRAGQLLTQMVRALEQTREQVFIANTLKCRPPNNRDPLPQELAACEHFLHRQIQLIEPKVIVALGRISAQALLKSEQPLGKMRGQVYQYGVDKTPLVVTYHPAYLLRSPADKAKTWADLLLAQQQLDK